MRKITKTLSLILGIVFLFELVDTALHLWAWRTRNPRMLQFVKRYNKYVENPLYLRFSGRLGHTATVHHVGRRSGTTYATPVRAHQTPQDVIVPLPYGPNVDWLRNLRAAGHGVVDIGGRSLEVDEPAVVDIDDVVGLLPDSLVRVVHVNGAREAARMRISGTTALVSA
jgi:deazaflavin-dependent oxidoreductase (nitroreductase family)